MIRSVLTGVALLLCAAFAHAQAPAAQSAEPRFEIRKFVIDGATLVSPQELDAATRPYAGKDKNFADVQRALEAIEKLYTAKGYSAIQVFLPEQELEKGEVRFKVIEARIGKIIVEGNKNFDAANIRNSLPSLKEGEAPNTQRVAENLRLANESPAKQTQVLLRGGQDEALVDAVARVTDERPTKYSLSADNTGTAQTGIFRVGLGFQHANMFNRDHVLSMQYVTAPHAPNNPQTMRLYPSSRVFIVGGSYHIPLYELGDSLDFSAGYSNVNAGVIQNLFNISGSGTIFGVRYNHNLPRWGELDHKLALGWDWRAYESRVSVVGGGPSLVPDVTVQPLSLTYSGAYRAATHETNFYYGVYQNLPAHNDAGQERFDMSRPGADVWYFLQRYGVNHNRSFANDMQMRIAFSGQFTRDRLVSGEQWGLGGADSVRGFLEREISNDWGFRGSLELYSPDFAGKLLSGSGGYRIRALTFYDWGRAQRNRPTVLETPKQQISSFGVGLRVSKGTNMFLRADFATVLDPAGSQGRGDGRMHASFSYIF